MSDNGGSKQPDRASRRRRERQRRRKAAPPQEVPSAQESSASATSEQDELDLASQDKSSQTNAKPTDGITAAPSDEEVANHEAASPAEPPLERADLRRSPVSPIKVRAESRKLFLAFLLVGGMILFVLPQWADNHWLTVTVGVSLMVLYMLIGISRGWTKSPPSREVFADSIYYLGFLYTFVALLGAIGPFSKTSGGLSSDEVVAHMGVALATTIYGMAARLVLTHFDQVVSEPNEALQEELTSLANELSQELQETLEGIRQFRDGAMRDAKEQNADLAAALQSQLGGAIKDLADELNNSTSKLTDAVQQFEEQVKRINVPPSLVSDRVNSAFSGFDRKVGELGATAENVGEKLDTVGTQSETTSDRLATTASALAQLTTQATKISGIGSTADTVNDALKILDSTIQSVSVALTQLESRTQREIDARIAEMQAGKDELTEAMTNTKAEIEGLNRSARSMTESVKETTTDIIDLLRDELRQR